MAAIQPDWGMGATVVLRNAEGRHGIPGHPGKAIPFSIHVTVTFRLIGRVTELEFRVPPRLIQTNVGRTRIKGWNTGRENLVIIHSRMLIILEPCSSK